MMERREKKEERKGKEMLRRDLHSYSFPGLMLSKGGGEKKKNDRGRGKKKGGRGRRCVSAVS